MNIVNAIFINGLTLDILGAYYLAQSFITKDIEDLTFEGTSGYGSPPNLRYIRSNLYQKAEARIGFGCLFSGFLLQSLDYFILESELTIELPRLGVFIFNLLFGFTLYEIMSIVKHKIFKKYGKKMSLILLKEYPKDYEPEDEWIKNVAIYLLPQINQKQNETDNEYSTRILKYVGAVRNRK